MAMRLPRRTGIKLSTAAATPSYIHSRATWSRLLAEAAIAVQLRAVGCSAAINATTNCLPCC